MAQATAQADYSLGNLLLMLVANRVYGATNSQCNEGVKGRLFREKPPTNHPCYTAFALALSVIDRATRVMRWLGAEPCRRHPKSGGITVNDSLFIIGRASFPVKFSAAKILRPPRTNILNNIENPLRRLLLLPFPAQHQR